MQHTINQDKNALCLLVEVIATASQNKPWTMSLDKVQISDERIRRVSMDKFYEMVTGDKFAFKRLCEVLPQVITDVVMTLKQSEIVQNTVLAELSVLAPDSLLRSIYLLSFQRYQGFDNFHFCEL